MLYFSRLMLKFALSLGVISTCLVVVKPQPTQAQNATLGYQDRIFKQKYIVDDDMPKETLEGYLGLFLLGQFNDETIERKLGGKCVPREVFQLEKENSFKEAQLGLSLVCNVQALLYKQASQDKYVTDKQLASIIMHYRKNVFVGAVDIKFMDNGEFIRRFKIAADFAERAKRIDYAFTFHEKALSQKIPLISKEERVPFNELYSTWKGFDKHAKSFHDVLSQAEVDYKTKRDKEMAEAEIARKRQEEELRVKREKELAEAAEARRIADEQNRARLEKERLELIEKLDTAYKACIEPRNTSISDCNFFLDKASTTDNVRLSAVLKTRAEDHFQQKRFREAQRDFQRASTTHQADSFITTRLNEIEIILKLEALNKERLSFLELAKKEYVSTVRTSLSQIAESYKDTLSSYKELNRHVQYINSLKNSSRTQSGIERRIEQIHDNFAKPLERIKIQEARIVSIRKTIHAAEGKVLSYSQEIKTLDQKSYVHAPFQDDGMRGEEQVYVQQNPQHGEVIKEITFTSQSVIAYLKSIEADDKKQAENQNEQQGLRQNSPQQPVVQQTLPQAQIPQQQVQKQEQAQPIPQTQVQTPSVNNSVVAAVPQVQPVPQVQQPQLQTMPQVQPHPQVQPMPQVQPHPQVQPIPQVQVVPEVQKQELVQPSSVNNGVIAAVPQVQQSVPQQVLQPQLQTMPQVQPLPQVQPMQQVQSLPQVQASVQPQGLTQSELGQCQIGTQCVITQKSLFCKTMPQMNMVLRAPIGQERKKLLDTFKETGDCLIVDANGVMQVKSPQNEQKVTSVRHPAFGDGFTLWDAFVTENRTAPFQQNKPQQVQAVTANFKLTCSENVNAGGEPWSREGVLTFKDGQSTYTWDGRDKASANDVVTLSASLNGTSLNLNVQRIAKSYDNPWRITFNGQVREDTKQLNLRGGLHRVTPQNTQGALQRNCTLVLSSEQPLTLAKSP